MNIRSLTTLVGVFPVLSEIGATGQVAWSSRRTEFTGRFTLPFRAKWGELILSEGKYTLHFGTIGRGIYFVEILGAHQGSPQGIFIVQEQGPSSVVQNALVCISRSGGQVIRALELPAIGKSVSFLVPHSTKLREKPRGSLTVEFAGARV